MFGLFKKKNPEPARLCFETDIHCHIVPGVDDGSPDADTSADLVRHMSDWGIKRIIASPHVTQNTFENDSTTIDPAVAELRAKLKEQGIGVEVSNAAEYRIDELLMRRLEANELMLLPGNHILIENSFIVEPWNLDQLVFDLQVRGLVPILAHPERYSYYYSRKNRYRELRSNGLNLQINLLSLAGAYGKAERKVAEWLIGEGLVDFIGTDLHRQEHVDAIEKYLVSKEAHADMAALAGLVKNDTL